jgi:hypothetical protein
MYSEIRCKVVKCRKDHCCEWCGEDIEKGTEAKNRTYKFEGELNHAWMHLECFKAMEESDYDTVADGWYPGDNQRGKTI